jgi:hypothetical protein
VAELRRKSVMLRSLLLWATGCLALAGCVRFRAPAATPGDWVLVHPPEVREEGRPKGYRLLPDAPLSDWRPQASFATEVECDQARRKNTDDSIDRARAEVGDQAKFELTVRRAVQALCVKRDALR